MKKPSRRLWLTILWVFLAAGVVYCGSVYWLIRKQASQDEAQRADCIVVLGAAQYNGRPSPVLRARLDHAMVLFRQGLAPRIITTGGYGPDRRFSEAGVARDYLLRRGIPESVVEADAIGETTVQSAASVEHRMAKEGLRSCILVSDGFHLFRCKSIFARRGVSVYASPDPESPIENSAGAQIGHSLREVLVYTALKLGVSI